MTRLGRGMKHGPFLLFISYLFVMRKIYITEKQKNHLKKAIAAQDQVGGKVNAGIMGAVTGMVCEGKKRKNDKGETVPEKCTECGDEVVVKIHGEPVYVCKKCGKYYGTMPFTLNEDVDDQEYQIGFEKGGFEPYGHVVNEDMADGGTITLYHGVMAKNLEYDIEHGGFEPRVCSEGGPKAIWLSEKRYGYQFIFKFDFPKSLLGDKLHQMTTVDYVYDDFISFNDFNCQLVETKISCDCQDFYVHVDLLNAEMCQKQGSLLKDLWLTINKMFKPYQNVLDKFINPYIEKYQVLNEGILKEDQDRIRDYNLFWGDESVSINESHEWCDDFNYAPYFKSICDFFVKKGLNIEPYPHVKLHRKEQEGLYIKTGYYDPETKEVHLFVADRHPKDVLRSFAHELIHHSQNLAGTLGGYKGQTLDGDGILQKLESEAYLKGNIYFRKWTEELHPVLPQVKKKLNESMQDILNISDDFDEYGVGKIINEFFSDKRRGIAKKQWSLIPTQQYQNLLTRYMQDPIMARIPDNIVYKWFMQVVRNVYDLEWMTELCGHTNGLDIDSAREAIDYEFGEGEYEINDWHDVIDLLNNYGFDDWCRLPDDSPACTDYGLQPLFKELSYYKPGMSGGDLLVLLNRVLHVGHVNGDLASAFIEGGSRSCSQISGIVREQAEQPQYFTEDHFKFWNWFGGSKVVDKNGQPLPMYHGTNAEFTAFSKEYFTHGSTAYLGIGFNFVSSQGTAVGYGKNVHEVYLRAINPMTNLKKTITLSQVQNLVRAIDGDEDPDGRISTGLLGYRVVNLTMGEIIKTARIIYDFCKTDDDIYSQFSVCYNGDNDEKVPAAFKQLGFDSSIEYDKYSGRIVYVVVFEPNQIKSVNAQNFNLDSDEMIDEDFDMGETTEPGDVDLSSFDVKPELNQRFWEGGKLNNEIRLKLMEIADDFMDYLGVDFEPVDIIVTGSIANYNWNQEHSDVDLHIVANFADISDNTELIKSFFDDKRKIWNDEHQGITIAGFPVELYVQDAKEPHASSGVYSIEKNKWLVKPSLEKLSPGEMDDDEVKKRVAMYMNEIDDLADEYEDRVADLDLDDLYEKADELFKRIKKERKEGFTTGGGEYNNGNIVFKTLRRTGYTKKLLNLRTKAYDQSKSLFNENNKS